MKQIFFNIGPIVCWHVEVFVIGILPKQVGDEESKYEYELTTGMFLSFFFSYFRFRPGGVANYFVPRKYFLAMSAGSLFVFVCKPLFCFSMISSRHSPIPDQKSL